MKTQPWGRRLIGGAGAGALIALCASGARADDFIFSDGGFANADWSIDMVISSGNVGNPPTGAQDGAGGNPGAYRQAAHRDFDGVLATWHMRAGAVHNPAVQGPITSLTCRLDLRAIQNLFDVNVAVHIGIIQNGVGFMGPGFLNNVGAWETFPHTITAEQFGLLDNPNIHPDFSAAGAPMRFGFVCTNDNFGFFATRVVGVDNWLVIVHTPTSVACSSADIATSGNPDPQAGPDGFVTGEDFDLFIFAYFKELRRTSDNSLIADLTDGTGAGGPDGFVTGTDFDRFVELYFAGC